MWENVTVTNLHDVDLEPHSQGVGADALEDIGVYLSSR